MRLIDVSKLKKIRIEHQRSVYSHGRIEGYNACIEDLENQPEVKAIPIEFIKEQIAKTTDINDEEEFDVLYAGNLGYLLTLWEEQK